jgi:hypothetical protein
MNTSEAIANETAAVNSVNPFSLEPLMAPPILIEQVSHSPEKETRHFDSKMTEFNATLMPDTNSLMMQ